MVKVMVTNRLLHICIYLCHNLLKHLNSVICLDIFTKKQIKIHNIMLNVIWFSDVRMCNFL